MSDDSQSIAQPIAPLSRRAGRRFPLQALKTRIEGSPVVGIVVGLPLTPEGDEDDRAACAREIGSVLELKTNLPVALVDERMTTARALSAVQELGGRVRGREAEIDSLAATVLLQSFLDSRRS